MVHLVTLIFYSELEVKKWCIFTGQEGRETLAVGKEGSKEGKGDSRADKADKASKADEVDKADV